jgi:ribose 1,5-bisphosphokinase PhnN
LTLPCSNRSQKLKSASRQEFNQRDRQGKATVAWRCAV